MDLIYHLFFYLEPSPASHLRGPKRDSVISCDDGGDVCVRSKSTHKERASWPSHYIILEQRTCKTQNRKTFIKSRESFCLSHRRSIFKNSSRLLNTWIAAIAPNPNCLLMEIFNLICKQFRKMWRPGAEAQPRALWLNLCSEFVERFFFCLLKAQREKKVFVSSLSSSLKKCDNWILSGPCIRPRKCSRAFWMENMTRRFQHH